jgi:hypothetical protein
MPAFTYYVAPPYIRTEYGDPVGCRALMLLVVKPLAWHSLLPVQSLSLEQAIQAPVSSRMRGFSPTMEKWDY